MLSERAIIIISELMRTDKVKNPHDKELLDELIAYGVIGPHVVHFNELWAESPNKLADILEQEFEKYSEIDTLKFYNQISQERLDVIKEDNLSENAKNVIANLSRYGYTQNPQDKDTLIELIAHGIITRNAAYSPILVSGMSALELTEILNSNDMQQYNEERLELQPDFVDRINFNEIKEDTLSKETVNVINELIKSGKAQNPQNRNVLLELIAHGIITKEDINSLLLVSKKPELDLRDILLIDDLKHYATDEEIKAATARGNEAGDTIKNLDGVVNEELTDETTETTEFATDLFDGFTPDLQNSTFIIDDDDIGFPIDDVSEFETDITDEQGTGENLDDVTETKTENAENIGEYNFDDFFDGFDEKTEKEKHDINNEVPDITKSKYNDTLAQQNISREQKTFNALANEKYEREIQIHQLKEEQRQIRNRLYGRTFLGRLLKRPFVTLFRLMVRAAETIFGFGNYGQKTPEEKRYDEIKHEINKLKNQSIILKEDKYGDIHVDRKAQEKMDRSMKDEKETTEKKTETIVEEETKKIDNPEKETITPVEQAKKEHLERTKPTMVKVDFSKQFAKNFEIASQQDFQLLDVKFNKPKYEMTIAMPNGNVTFELNRTRGSIEHKNGPQIDDASMKKLSEYVLMSTYSANTMSGRENSLNEKFTNGIYKRQIDGLLNGDKKTASFNVNGIQYDVSKEANGNLLFKVGDEPEFYIPFTSLQGSVDKNGQEITSEEKFNKSLAEINERHVLKMFRETLNKNFETFFRSCSNTFKNSDDMKIGKFEIQPDGKIAIAVTLGIDTQKDGISSEIILDTENLIAIQVSDEQSRHMITNEMIQQLAKIGDNINQVYCGYVSQYISPDKVAYAPDVMNVINHMIDLTPDNEKSMASISGMIVQIDKTGGPVNFNGEQVRYPTVSIFDLNKKPLTTEIPCYYGQMPQNFENQIKESIKSAMIIAQANLSIGEAKKEIDIVHTDADKVLHPDEFDDNPIAEDIAFDMQRTIDEMSRDNNNDDRDL